MSQLSINKIETTQVPNDGTGARYGFVISEHSPTEEFNFLGTKVIDTDALSPDDQAIVDAFIILMEEKLLES